MFLYITGLKQFDYNARRGNLLSGQDDKRLCPSQAACAPRRPCGRVEMSWERVSAKTWNKTWHEGKKDKERRKREMENCFLL